MRTLVLLTVLILLVLPACTIRTETVTIPAENITVTQTATSTVTQELPVTVTAVIPPWSQLSLLSGPLPGHTFEPFSEHQSDEVMAILPGDINYLANIPEDLAPGLPPIPIATATITKDGTTLGVSFRQQIDTLPGETHYNIVKVISPTGLFAEPQINLYLLDAPSDFNFTQSGTYRTGLGNIGVVVLTVEVASDARLGQYDFDIGITLYGTDYGVIACSINVR